MRIILLSSFAGSKWKNKDLTYKISKYSKQMNELDTDKEVRRAFKLWSDVTPLTFTQKKSGPVNILDYNIILIV